MFGRYVATAGQGLEKADIMVAMGGYREGLCMLRPLPYCMLVTAKIRDVRISSFA